MIFLQYCYGDNIFDSVKKLFMTQCFKQRNINTFNALQVCTDENKFLQIKMGAHK